MYISKIPSHAEPYSDIESRSLDLLKNTQLEQTVAIIANPFGRRRSAITMATQNLQWVLGCWCFLVNV